MYDIMNCDRKVTNFNLFFCNFWPTIYESFFFLSFLPILEIFFLIPQFFELKYKKTEHVIETHPLYVRPFVKKS